MRKCVVKMIIDDKEIVARECNSYVEANQFKNFKMETDHRENVEYIIRES